MLQRKVTFCCSSNLDCLHFAGKRNITVFITGARPKVRRSLTAQKGGVSLVFYNSLEEAGHDILKV